MDLEVVKYGDTDGFDQTGIEQLLQSLEKTQPNVKKKKKSRRKQPS